MTLSSDMLRRDRERQGLRLARAAWLLGVTVRELRELEAGERYPSSVHVRTNRRALRVAAGVHIAV
jgi:predicted transcriptional regulator